MNTKSICFPVLLISVLLSTCPCVGQSNVVFYGTNASSISVLFVDTNLSASAKASIVADLQVCLGEWGKMSELDLGNYEPGVVGYLYNFKHNPHYPEGIEFPRKLITNSVSGIALQVPKTLSDAYTNAFVFAAANSNVIAAAYEFVAFVSSSNFFSTVASNTIHNYVLVKDMTGSYYQSKFSNIIEGLFQHPKYYLPSLLGFYHSSDGPGTNNLYMTLPTKTNPGHGYEEWDGIPAIWQDNRWKICIGYEWVP